MFRLGYCARGYRELEGDMADNHELREASSVFLAEGLSATDHHPGMRPITESSSNVW
jgi:hypothetical protein